MFRVGKIAGLSSYHNFMFESYSVNPVFNVKAMSHQTGVAAATLRAWERRYGVPSPPRTDSGYRLYSARDVAIIRWLKAQLETGMNISQAVSLLQSSIQQLEVPRVISPPAANLPASQQRLHNDVLAATMAFDEIGVERALNEAFALFPVEEVFLNLLQPVMVTVGEKWHTGELTIGHEHFITNLVRRRLITLLAATPMPHQRIVTACAPDEFHELGLLMISVFLRRNGYAVVYLGQNTPAVRIEEVLERVQPEAVLMSASGLRSAARLLSLYETLSKRRSNKHPLVLAYGGHIFGQIPTLRERMPGTWISGGASEAARHIDQMMKHRNIGSTRSVPIRAITQEVVEELRMRKPDIVAHAARRIVADPLDLNHIGHKSERAIDAAERLFYVLDASACFDDASILTDATDWEWDSFTSEGIVPEQLQVCARHFCDAVRICISPPTCEFLEPFLHEMIEALTMDSGQP